MIINTDVATQIINECISNSIELNEFSRLNPQFASLMDSSIALAAQTNLSDKEWGTLNLKEFGLIHWPNISF